MPRRHGTWCVKQPDYLVHCLPGFPFLSTRLTNPPLLSKDLQGRERESCSDNRVHAKREETMALARIPRYSSAGSGLISFDKLPSGISYEVVPLTAEDRGESKGVLYTKGGEKTVVCLMHPRADMTRHYAVPYLLEAGYAAFGQEGRWPGNDIACIHEMLLPDIAAGIKFLKEQRGFSRSCLSATAVEV